MNFKDLHNAICNKLKEEIPAIQTCEIYPSIRKELLAPAVFVELSGFEKGHDPAVVLKVNRKILKINFYLVDYKAKDAFNTFYVI